MARFSDDELDRIRKETDIVALIESYGTKLKQRPDQSEYMGKCPLHDDETPSLFVNRTKGLWQCKGACGCGGDCIAWVMKAEKCSFRHAVELLQAKAVGVLAGNGTKAYCIRAIALLHQYQRPIHTTTIEGHVREYIEVTAADIVLANRLADAVLGRSIDELPPQTRRLLWQLTEFVRQETESKDILQNEVRFLRRDIRERFGWGQTQLKLHLDRLIEMEYVLAHRTATRTIEYELLFDGRGREGQPTLPGLIDPTKCNPLSTPTISSSGVSEPTSAPMMPISGAMDETSGLNRAIIAPSSNDNSPLPPHQTSGESGTNAQM